MRDKKICMLVTSSLAIKTLCVGQVENLVKRGARVTLIAAPGEEHEVVLREGGLSVGIPMKRTPSFFSDIVSLVRIWMYLLFHRQDLVVVSTPKASLLGSFAAIMSFHWNIVFIVRGCAFENYTGVRLAFYQFLERIICFLATNVQFVSRELMTRYVKKGLCKPDKAFIVGGGSSKGIDMEVFSPSRFSADHRALKRAGYGIADDAFVWIYCGRVRRDKGINELVNAFMAISADCSHHHMLLVGPYEDWDPLDEGIWDTIQTNPSITHVSWTDDVASFMAISDAFVFPSHREGFGNVAIEAAAMELPVVAFDVVGCRESVKHGTSGLLVKGISSSNFEAGMRQLIENSNLYNQLKETARPWVAENFDRKVIFSEIADKYRTFLKR